jgi:hypothetical protein
MSANFGQSPQRSFVNAISADPSWKTAYEKTVWESDTEELLTSIHATEAALFERWLEISGADGHNEERGAMKAAADDLLEIKIRKLGWPNPCK